jgi:hypothetical protein
MAVVHEEAPYDAYAERLAACDVFVSPFPYGNMNSIVDAALLGLPGVCLDGAEAHAHADAAYFRRMGFAEALIAQSREAYVAAIVSPTIRRGSPIAAGSPRKWGRRTPSSAATPRCSPTLSGGSSNRRRRAPERQRPSQSRIGPGPYAITSKRRGGDGDGSGCDATGGPWPCRPAWRR